MCWYCWGQSFKICMSIFSTLNHAYKILVKMYVYFVSKCINFAIHFKIIVVGFIGNYFLFIHSYYQVHAKIILWGCLKTSKFEYMSGLLQRLCLQYMAGGKVICFNRSQRTCIRSQIWCPVFLIPNKYKHTYIE